MLIRCKNIFFFVSADCITIKKKKHGSYLEISIFFRFTQNQFLLSEVSVFENCTDCGLQNLLLENTIVVLIIYIFLNFTDFNDKKKKKCVY